MQPDCALVLLFLLLLLLVLVSPSSVKIVVHAVNARGRASLVIEQTGIVILVLVIVVFVDRIVLEAAVYKVPERGGVVREVVLLKQMYKVVKIQGNCVVLKRRKTVSA
jgi:hypothetical protein